MCHQEIDAESMHSTTGDEELNDKQQIVIRNSTDSDYENQKYRVWKLT